MKRILTIAVVIFCLVIIKNLATSIYTLWRKQDLLTQTQQQLELEKKKNQEIKAKLSYTQSNAFIEEEARNKLFLGKEGESEVIIPPSLQQAAVSKPLSEQNDTRSNFEKWKDLFFY